MTDIILFDLDGTLTDPAVGITGCVRYALESVGITDPDPVVLMRFIGPPLVDSFMSFYGFDRAAADKLVEKYRERFAVKGIFENRLYDGIKPMLDVLKKSGKTIALATSKPKVFAERIIEHYGIAEYFDVTSGAELDGRNNYKHEVIYDVMNKLGNPDKARVIMVGDRKQDIEGAHACGISAVGVRFGYAEPQELESAGADYIAEDVDSLCKLLLKL